MPVTSTRQPVWNEGKARGLLCLIAFSPLVQGFPTFFAARTPLSGQSILSTPQKNFEIYIAL